MLESLGADLGRIRKQVIQILSNNQGKEAIRASSSGRRDDSLPDSAKEESKAEGRATSQQQSGIELILETYERDVQRSAVQGTAPPPMPVTLWRVEELDDDRGLEVLAGVEPLLAEIEKVIADSSLDSQGRAEVEADRSILAACLRTPTPDFVTVVRAINRIAKNLGPQPSDANLLAAAAREAGFGDPINVANQMIAAVSDIGALVSTSEEEAASSLTTSAEALTFLAASANALVGEESEQTWRDEIRQGRHALLSEQLPRSIAEWFTPKGVATAFVGISTSFLILPRLLMAIAHLINAFAK